MGHYKNYKQKDITNPFPGYSDEGFITPLDFVDVFPPTLGNAAMGNKNIINTDIVYKEGFGSIQIYFAPDSVEGDGELVGEKLAKRFQWKPKVIIVGEGPIVQELAENIMNTRFLLHVRTGECEGDQFVQFGSKCTPCTVVEGSFKSGNLAGGRKQYEFTLETYKKYFYNGVIVPLDDDTEVSI